MAGFYNRSIIVDDTKDVEEADQTIEVGSNKEGEDKVLADNTKDKDYIEEATEDISKDIDKSKDKDYVKEEEVREGSNNKDYSIGKGSEVSSGKSKEGDAKSVKDKEIIVGSSNKKSVKETIEVNIKEYNVVLIIMISVNKDIVSEIRTDNSKDKDYSKGESYKTVV